MANTRGVFTLQDVRYAQEDEVWVSPDQAFASNITAPPNVGYFGGGYTPTWRREVDKTNFTSETTARVPAADLTQAKSDMAGSSSAQAGYYSGGNVPPNSSLSEIDKLTYNTETVSISPQSDLPISVNSCAGANSPSSAYQAGGNFAPGGTPVYSNVNKMSFATEQFFRVPSADLTHARQQVTAFSSEDEMYILGGYDGTYRSITDKLTFATDTTARIPGADLSAPISAAASASNGTLGYVANGSAAPNNSQSFVDKITFATSTRSTLGSNMPVARNSGRGAGNSTDSYFAGGNFGPGGTPIYSSIFKIDYSTDNISTAGGNLSAAKRSFAAVSPRMNGVPQTTGYVASTQNLKALPTPGHGYWTGANFPGGTNVVKHNFSTDNAGRVPSAPLNTARYAHAGLSNGNNFYASAGGNPALTSTERISYASDTATLIPGANTEQTARVVMGFGNKDKGYILGGQNGPTDYSIVTKLSYSSETTTRVPGGNLIQDLGISAGAGTPSFGVLGGGFSVDIPGRVSYFQKLQYSSDTNARIPSANLPQANNNLTGTGNGYAGYRAGGETPGNISNISRHVYSTDLVSYLPQSLVNGDQTNFESNGSGQAAYWGGQNSNVNKMNYSTETGYSLPTTRINQSYMGAASAEEFDMPQPRPETPTLSTSDIPSSPNTGYFGGGLSPVVSIMDKLNYSTEIMERVPSGNLSAGRALFGATGNSTNGYFGGGYDGGPISIFNKLTYSTDSTANLPGTNLSVPRYSHAATSSSTAGYFGGGNNPGLTPNAQSTVDKLSYSDDTLAAVPGAALETRVFYVAAAGNSSAGYWGAGRNPSLSPINVTTMQKIIFSTDTSTTIPSGALTAARYGLASAGNSDVGYFMGGYSIGWFPTSRMTSVIDKITYSTETSSLVPGGTITPRGFMDGTGSSSAGYITGGNTPGPDTTRTEKLTFTTETSVDLPGAQFTQALWGVVGTSARANSVSATSNVL